ncbi:uncharacterized protein LOC115888299 isoform X2 [Sitophilus oryzae]|uniref:Uncharacterized protein LOC115888299 isoform X2 n=1 Tax=Sitophilus oryzae TaxID=7048 RepID=A0A6J2YL17_SITOR|nr:uncharacterized protein LOC115888299 isoform X2 [Sitophilus oryzae]
MPIQLATMQQNDRTMDDRPLYITPALTPPGYDLGDFAEMESMQFVNPHDVNPPQRSDAGHSQVSSKSLNMPQNVDIQLKMEEFGDLSGLLPAATTNANLIDCIDELNTPIFDKDPFDFFLQGSKLDDKMTTTTTPSSNDLKVKVEYNAHVYQWPSLQARAGHDPTSISVGAKHQEMFLYQPQANAHNNVFTYNNKTTTTPNNANPFMDPDIYRQPTALDSLSVNSNVKYSSSSNVPSPQDDQYSYISSSADEQQLGSPFDGHMDVKPKLNLMIDEFRFPIKEEASSTLNTPDVIDDVVNMGTEFNLLDLINNEDITILSTDEDLNSTLVCPTEISTPLSPPSTPSTAESKPSSPPAKRPRKRKTFFDEDDDEDYIPPTKRKSTVSLKEIDLNYADEHDSSEDDSDYEVRRKSPKKVKSTKPRGRPPKRTDSMSSECSKDSELSKYRELRDKNNEASRKSRLKRKVKELEYEKEADELHVKNIRLKAQVEELEKMVSTFRNNLFKILVNK